MCTATPKSTPPTNDETAILHARLEKAPCSKRNTERQKSETRTQLAAHHRLTIPRHTSWYR